MRFAALLLLAGGCSSSSRTGADLSGFDTARITANGVEIEVWLADTGAQQLQGLMFATEVQLDPLPDGTPRGMLFRFASEDFRSFFMKDTFVPLDLAYATADGTIVEIHSLVPLDLTPVTSSEPVQFALEVPAGTLAAEGIGVGDVIVIPPGA